MRTAQLGPLPDGFLGDRSDNRTELKDTQTPSLTLNWDLNGKKIVTN